MRSERKLASPLTPNCKRILVICHRPKSLSETSLKICSLQTHNSLNSLAKVCSELGHFLSLHTFVRTTFRPNTLAKNRPKTTYLPIPSCCAFWYTLPSVNSDGAITTSTCCISLRSLAPKVPMLVVSAPNRLWVPSSSWAGPLKI